MLMQNFKSAAELDLTDEQYDALKKVLVLLETSKLNFIEELPEFWPYNVKLPEFTGHFNMAHWTAVAPCGTVACIGGTAELIAGKRIFGGIDGDHPPMLHNLFYPTGLHATTEQAARALRNYLTSGDADWNTVLGLHKVNAGTRT